MFDIEKIDTEKLISKVSANLKPPPKQVTFSIPENHPAADKLLKLMINLQTAMVMPSGLQLQQRENDSEAVREMLEALHSVLLEEGADIPALDVLVEQQRAQPLTLPHLFQTVMQALAE